MQTPRRRLRLPIALSLALGLACASAAGAVGAQHPFTIVFAAPLGVAAMTEPTRQTWLNDLFDAVATTHEDYYEDSVTLLSLLVMTTNYWDPTTIGP